MTLQVQMSIPQLFATLKANGMRVDRLWSITKDVDPSDWSADDQISELLRAQQEIIATLLNVLEGGVR